jgi:hypothetical protein
MATTSASARASRRRAATEKAANISMPETLAEVMSADDEVDEAFGPDTLPGGSQKAQKSVPVSAPTNPPIVPAEATSARSGAIALPMEDLTRKIDVGDMVIPKLRISQAMSKANTLHASSRGTDGVQMGNWYNSANNQNFGETVYFVPADMRKTRAMFVQGLGLQCRSFDLVQGQGDPGILCEGTPEERLTVPEQHRGCPLRLWDDRTPPKCGMTYNFPGFVVLADDIDNPGREARLVQVMLQLRSTATKTARQLITFVMNEGGRVWANCLFELTLDAQTNTKGTFFVPVIDLYDTLDQPQYERIRRRAYSMSRAMGAVATESFEDGDSE